MTHFARSACLLVLVLLPAVAPCLAPAQMTRDQILEQRRSEAFSVFLGNIMAEYKKGNRIRMNAKAQQAPQIPGM